MAKEKEKQESIFAFNRKSLLEGVNSKESAQKALKKNGYLKLGLSTLAESLFNSKGWIGTIAGYIFIAGAGAIFPPVAVGAAIAAGVSAGLSFGVPALWKTFGPAETSVRAQRKKLHKIVDPDYRSPSDKLKDTFKGLPGQIKQNIGIRRKLKKLQAEHTKFTNALEEIKKNYIEGENVLSEQEMVEMLGLVRQIKAKLADIEPEIKKLERKIQEGNRMFKRKNKKANEQDAPVAGGIAEDLRAELDLPPLNASDEHTLTDTPQQEQSQIDLSPLEENFSLSEDAPVVATPQTHEQTGVHVQEIINDVSRSALIIRDDHPIRVGEDAAKILAALQKNNELYYSEGCFGDGKDILKLTNDKVDELVGSELRGKLNNFTPITVDSKEFDIKGTLACLELCAERGDLAAAKAHFAINSLLDQQLQIEAFQNRVIGGMLMVDAYALKSIDNRGDMMSTMGDLTCDNYQVNPGPIEGNEYDVYVNQFDKYLDMLRKEMKHLEAGVFPGTETPMPDKAIESVSTQTQEIIDKLEHARSLQVQASSYVECANHCDERYGTEKSEGIRGQLRETYNTLNDRLYDLKNSDKLQEVTDRAIEAVEAKFPGTWQRTNYKAIADQAKSVRTSTRANLPNQKADFGQFKIGGGGAVPGGR